MASAFRPEVSLSEKLALTYVEAATLIGISENKLVDIVNSGEMHKVNIGRRVLIPRFEIERYLRELVMRQQTKE